MKKTFRTEIRRTFLLERLPGPLNPASEHLQFFDNYIENTALRIRTCRSPKTKEWRWSLEKRKPAAEGDNSIWHVSEIELDEAEHTAFEYFEGREISKNERIETNELRFNRYFYEYQGKQVEIDIFLNPLFGLNIAKVFFESEEERDSFEMPAFAAIETTQNPFFNGSSLLGKTIDDIKNALSKRAGQ